MNASSAMVSVGVAFRMAALIDSSRDTPATTCPVTRSASPGDAVLERQVDVEQQREVDDGERQQQQQRRDDRRFDHAGSVSSPMRRRRAGHE